MTPIDTIDFPCEEVPEATDARRLLGIYEMRREGRLMQRIKVHAGRLTPEQLGALADTAARYTPEYPVHVTTRQDIELHGVRPPDVPGVQRRIRRMGLTTAGACGDTLRNVTTCPGCGLCPGGVDVSQAADAVRTAAESMPFITDMPRKFKISFSGCRNKCARPWINDLGFVALEDGRFRAVGSGSLGPRPGTGIELYESLGADQIVPLIVAALRFFNAEGDRENRGRARFRHVRERIGEHEFRSRLDEGFRRELKAGDWPVPAAPRCDEEGPAPIRFHLPKGDISQEAASELSEAAEATGAAVRIGFEHDLWVFSPEALSLSDRLRALRTGPSIVSCPGNTWCRRGIADTRGAEEGVRVAEGDGLAGLRLCFSGCPNNCAHAAVADIGLTGCIKSFDGVRTKCFRLYAGGGKGKDERLARRLHLGVPAELVPGVIEDLVAEYRRAAADDVSFADFAAHEREHLARMVEETVEGYQPR
ncbi:MAG: hypothetical protein ACOC7T_03945 [Planctomycetota bacterium]